MNLGVSEVQQPAPLGIDHDDALGVDSSTSTPQGMESIICCRAARMRSFSARLLVSAALRSASSRPRCATSCCRSRYEASSSDEAEMNSENASASSCGLRDGVRTQLVYWNCMRTRQHLPI